MKRFNKFLIKYSLIIIIILVLIILWGVFYLLSGPMIYQGEAILGNWITVLIFLVTVSAGVMPFVLNDRQNKFEKEINKKIEIFNNKFSKYDFNIENIHSALAQFYYRNLIPYIDKFNEKSNIETIISLIDNFLLALYMSKNISLAINCANDIKKTNLYAKRELLKKNAKEYFSINPMTSIAEWKDFFRDELKFKIFITVFDFIYEGLEGYPPPDVK